MSRSSRKKEHIQLALREEQNGEQGLKDVRFVHNCLPEIAMEEIQLTTKIGGLQLSSPIIVNAMTGGAIETSRINSLLALIARESGIALAVGSQMAAIKDSSLKETYGIVRKVNPKGIIFANLGAEATPEMAKRAVDMIGADGLQIHLNAVQELVMPEGDRNFKGVLGRIEQIIRSLDVPVIVKEVGFGVAREAAQKLVDVGVAAIDVGGKGGTNFARIENSRRQAPMEFFNEWGLSTASSLLELSFFHKKVNLIASGGIRTSLDMARCFALGAHAVGIAGPFLKFAVEGNLEGALAFVNQVHEDLRNIMGALGKSTISGMSEVPVVVSGETYHWATMRGIDCRTFALRNL